MTDFQNRETIKTSFATRHIDAKSKTEFKRRISQGGGGRYAFTRKNGHKPISRFYLEKIRNSLYKMTLEIWLKQKFSTISVNDCYI
jgi:hypothetical protein